MTPKLAGALQALKQLKSAAEDVADEITNRIVNESMPALNKAKAGAHKTIDGMHTVVDDIEEFTTALIGHNGAPGGPLDDSETQSESTPPRSSEVAQK